jgi:hypothetical protein
MPLHQSIQYLRVPFISRDLVLTLTSPAHQISLSPVPTQLIPLIPSHSILLHSIMPAQQFNLEDDYKSELEAFGQRIKARREAGL